MVYRKRIKSFKTTLKLYGSTPHYRARTGIQSHTFHLNTKTVILSLFCKAEYDPSKLILSQFFGKQFCFQVVNHLFFLRKAAIRVEREHFILNGKTCFYCLKNEWLADRILFCHIWCFSKLTQVSPVNKLFVFPLLFIICNKMTWQKAGNNH